MSKLKYVIGDATKPQGNGYKIICHIVNDVGAWGKGFVLALSKKWYGPEQDFRNQDYYTLGACGKVQVEDNIEVINMCAQRDIRSSKIEKFDQKDQIRHNTSGNYTEPRAPIRYIALGECIEWVAKHATEKNASIHAPRFGSGLAKGNWEIIEEMIMEGWIDQGIDVTIYDLE